MRFTLQLCLFCLLPSESKVEYIDGEDELDEAEGEAVRLPRCGDKGKQTKHALVKVCSVCPTRLSLFGVQPPSLSVAHPGYKVFLRPSSFSSSFLLFSSLT